MLKRVLFILAVALFAAAIPASAIADAGKAKAETCIGCHGIKSYQNVYPTYKVPMIAGQNAAYIEAALKAYRSGERKHGTMSLQAAGLSDQDIAEIAAYISSN